MARHQPFNRVGLFIKYPTKAIIDTLRKTQKYLQDQPITLCLEEKTASFIAKHNHDTHDITTLCKHIDALIVIGGDGSLLAAAIHAAKANIPLIGINRGKVGFLSDVNPQQWDTLHDLVHGKYKTEQRPLLQVTLNNHASPGWALNDIVLSRKQGLRLLEYDVFIDQSFVCHQRSDGLVVHTPTGSTAYALSAGGPIIGPSLPAIGLLPLCSHTLTSRPLVIAHTSSIDVHILPNSQAHCQVHHDGHDMQSPDPIQSLHIQSSDRVVTLAHPLCYDYFDTLKNKLHWEQMPYADLPKH